MATSWYGTPPEKCELCGKEIENVFFDARTIYGAWAFLCETCFERRGTGLGLGHGQRYEKQAKGFWLKVAG